MISLINPISRWMGFNPLSWYRDTRRMHVLIKDFRASQPPRRDAVRFLVVVMPWMGTAVPWFSLVCGLLLAATGNKVTFVVDDLPFGNHGLRFRFVLGCIRSALRLLRGRFEVIHLSQQVSGSALSRAARDSVARLAELNTVWALRGEMKTDGRRDHTEQAVRQLGASYVAIAGVLHAGRYDAMVVPGGVWGSSGIWTEHARSAGIRVASFDSGGYGTLMLAVNGIACQLQDIPHAFSLLKTHAASSGERAFIIQSALDEINRRRAGVDKFASQMEGAGEADRRFTGAILLALNSSWDSAALGLHAVFKDSTEWIVETTKYLLANSSALVIVRQHPAERLAFARTSEDYRGLLASHFGEHPRLVFVAADEPINSYALLEEVAAVVVYTSTLGIEAAAHGKPVVTPSHSYYSDLGFVQKATSLPQYHQYLSNVLAGAQAVSQAMRDDALCCYYLTQCCNWVFSPFNPEGFTEWSRYSLTDLSRHEKVRATVQALEENIPVAFLNHLARLEQQATSP